MAQNAATLADSTDKNPESLIVASFATYGELQAHITIVHPPTCQYCPTSFTTNKELIRHLEIQHGILPKTNSENAPVFQCSHDGCDKKFTKKGNLNVHVKTVHENKRDYVCGQTEITLPEEVADQQDVVVHGCNRSFTSKASLEEHVRTAHLGLESKRMIREKKRKADRESDNDVGGKSFKKRKPRSDKGVKKSSAMTGLTGVPIDQNNLTTDLTPAAADTNHQDDMDDDDADDNLLSGSMVMCGSQIFHYGSSYHYPSGEYPTQAFASVSVHDDDDADGNSRDDGFNFFRDHGTLSTGRLDFEVDDNFFGQFEQEPTGFAYPAL